MPGSTLFDVNGTDLYVDNAVFTGNSTSKNDYTRAITLAGSKIASFSNCTFSGSKNNIGDFLVFNGYTGTFTMNNSTFTGMQARNLIYTAEGQSTSTNVTFDNVKFTNNTVTNLIKQSNSTKMYLKNVSISGTNGVNIDAAASGITILDGTQILGVAGKTSVTVRDDSALYVGGKVTIKGAARNVYLDTATSYIDVEAGQKIKYGSEIYVSGTTATNIRFMRKWGEAFIEYYGRHDTPDGYIYHYGPDKIFKLDAEVANAGRRIYLDGAAGLQDLLLSKDKTS